jgi:hypothetical protein
MADKQAVLDALQRLPETVSLEEITEELRIMASVRRGRADIDSGGSRTPARILGYRMLARRTPRTDIRKPVAGRRPEPILICFEKNPHRLSRFAGSPPSPLGRARVPEGARAGEGSFSWFPGAGRRHGRVPWRREKERGLCELFPKGCAWSYFLPRGRLETSDRGNG